MENMFRSQIRICRVNKTIFNFTNHQTTDLLSKRNVFHDECQFLSVHGTVLHSADHHTSSTVGVAASEKLVVLLLSSCSLAYKHNSNQFSIYNIHNKTIDNTSEFW